MTQVLEGVRVLEVAIMAMVPASGAVLADWGAQVIKVEHPTTGDPVRGLSVWGIDTKDGLHCVWDPFNRGKRSIGIDIGTPDGRDLLLSLAKETDVFLTNFLPAARRNLGIDVEDLRAVNPRVIYARGSAYGPDGPDAERGGFDDLAYWQRVGLGSAAMSPGDDLPVHVPAVALGDSQAGMTLAGGVAAALYHRERTGMGSVVDVSLLSTGMWAVQSSFVGANFLGQPELPKFDRRTARNPLTIAYRTADNRFVVLSILQSQRYWADFCKAIGNDQLITDTRFDSGAGRREHAPELISILEEIFASHPLDFWEVALNRQEGAWGVVRRVGDINHDESAVANGYFQDVSYVNGESIRLVTAPVSFDQKQPVLRPAPGHGEQTEDILLEHGYDWDDIIRFKENGSIL